MKNLHNIESTPDLVYAAAWYMNTYIRLLPDGTIRWGFEKSLQELTVTWSKQDEKNIIKQWYKADSPKFKHLIII